MTARTDPPDRSQHDGDGDDEQLPCGRSLSDVWDLWEQEKDDPHLTDCPHCRQAVGELAALETSVRQLRERSATAEFYDARALTQRIMDVVRLELRPGRPLPLGEPEEDLWIVESAAARTVRAAAETVEGVRAGSCRISVERLPEREAPYVDVRLEIHAPASAQLQDLAEQVRHRVLSAADSTLGLPLNEIDIRITDLLDAADGPGGGEGR
ncbi:Asp23/Gls24 family envelope stress response protein [Streptomyces sp. wa22]|uniref:Asp23/Gls24 family envelope stress response protein n=1 Tax=Streptomyces sp. wa22 TaxID=1828244 RepID=UPI0011CA817A|nr:Asp23/Gls24 family envelope stress response protein [Streptomyces sp. wa22]TXS10616.1 Asp23/Gls24 family envelope stress response protein [Streptomyces sp. wa22]